MHQVDPPVVRYVGPAVAIIVIGVVSAALSPAQSDPVPAFEISSVVVAVGVLMAIWRERVRRQVQRAVRSGAESRMTVSEIERRFDRTGWTTRVHLTAGQVSYWVSLLPISRRRVPSVGTEATVIGQVDESHPMLVTVPNGDDPLWPISRAKRF